LYSDDKTTIYLANLLVIENLRRQGLATKLQRVHEQIGEILGATTSCLLVDRESWMYDWYNRLGYKNFENNISNEKMVWMKKTLNIKK
jgi:hypothetical protein